MTEARRSTLREGRDAALAAAKGAQLSPCPYRLGTERHRWWHDGAERTARLVNRIMEIGA